MARAAAGELALTVLALAVSSCLLLHLPASALPRPDRAAVDGGGGGRESTRAARTCWYTVQVKTSCSSPARTTDAVSLAFGDAYGDEVYAARLAAAFERCATDTFRVGGPCGYGVCYLYLRRAGRAGWTPEWVRVYEPTSSTPSTFRYGDPLPDGVWYGYNRCPHRAAAVAGGAAASSSSSSSAAVQAL